MTCWRGSVCPPLPAYTCSSAYSTAESHFVTTSGKKINYEYHVVINLEYSLYSPVLIYPNITSAPPPPPVRDVSYGDTSSKRRMIPEKNVRGRYVHTGTHRYASRQGCATLRVLTTYTVKKVIDFPVPRWEVTKQTLPGWEKFNYSRPGRVWLVNSRLGTEK